MHDNMLDSSHELHVNVVENYPLLDSNTKPPRVATWLQCPQDWYSSSNHFCETHHQASPNPLDPTSTATWGILDNAPSLDNTSQWPTSTTSPFSSHRPSASNGPTASHWSEAHRDGYVMHHYPIPMLPILSRINLPWTEFSRDQTHCMGHSPQHCSAPCHQPSAPLYASSLPLVGPGIFLESPSESPLQAVSQRSSRECYSLWKKIPEEAIIVTGSDEFIPQTMYKPSTETDKERYLERVCLSPPIIFLTEEPLEWGIPLEDVHNGRMRCLVDKDEPVLQNCGPSVSIRINWPGYPPFKRQISSRNWRKMRGPITKEQLARSLAKITSQFIEKMSHKPLEFGADRTWRVGIQHIKVEDLVLVSLHHVSKGSWQPQLRLRTKMALHDHVLVTK